MVDYTSVFINSLEGLSDEVTFRLKKVSIHTKRRIWRAWVIYNKISSFNETLWVEKARLKRKGFIQGSQLKLDVEISWKEFCRKGGNISSLRTLQSAHLMRRVGIGIYSIRTVNANQAVEDLILYA